MITYTLILLTGIFLLYFILQNKKQLKIIKNRDKENIKLKKEIKSLKVLNESLIETINEEEEKKKIKINPSETKRMADKALERTIKLHKKIKENDERIKNQIKYIKTGKIVN